MGLELPSALATSFGGGVGGQGEVCGVISGAALLVGLWGGREKAGDKEAYDRVRSKMREFIAGFQGEHGKLLCRELTGYDLRSPEGEKRFKDDPERRIKCQRFVETAAVLVTKLLA